jgi:glycine cleavage system T protein (aminomethyltransferase)
LPPMPDRTLLYSRHVALGARMFEFGGWEMPLWYTSIGEEHLAVRNGVGIFDASHMGKILIVGDGAGEGLGRLVTRNLAKYLPGKCVYAHLLDDQGRIIDDLIITKISQNEFFVVCNASTRQKVIAWISERKMPFRLKDMTGDFSCLAVQGPKAAELMSRIASPAVLGLKRYHGGLTMLGLPGDMKGDDQIFSWGEKLSLLTDRNMGGATAFVTRTGYTGEDGFEIFASSADTGFVWDGLLRTGTDLGIRPIGLGARDTLRLEMCYLLSGHDFDGSQTPLQADAEFVVDWDHEFVGKESLEKQRTEEYSRLVAFTSVGKGIPRSGYQLLSESGERIGKSTSGTISPSLKIGIGMGYVPPAYAKAGTKISYEVGNRGVEAKVVEKPFLKR